MQEDKLENTFKDLNPLDLKNSSNPKFKEAQDEDIYVMPVKFLKQEKKKKEYLGFII